ncbi:MULTISPECIES: hypothetical protein [Streptomyces]|uniref:Uncharacterized protein n=1 Tax=Streptomyces sp. 900129855 TaxID=3155129 RepID=A0ABV2ZYN2_9ACTN
MLLTTHDMSEAQQLADRIGILQYGRITACGTLAELSAAAKTRSEAAWTDADGVPQRRLTADPSEVVWQLHQQLQGPIPDLEVRRPTLENTYVQMAPDPSRRPTPTEKRRLEARTRSSRNPGLGPLAVESGQEAFLHDRAARCLRREGRSGVPEAGRGLSRERCGLPSPSAAVQSAAFIRQARAPRRATAAGTTCASASTADR